VTLPGGSAVYAKDLLYPVAYRCLPLANANFDGTVASIRGLDPQFGILACQGSLPFQPRDMILVPARFEKQSGRDGRACFRLGELEYQLVERRFGLELNGYRSTYRLSLNAVTAAVGRH